MNQGGTAGLIFTSVLDEYTCRGGMFFIPHKFEEDKKMKKILAA
jgi:hypothetical protein